ncbi:MAG: hypothetical protein GXP36_05675 [Actinobacteria bacterium]|nr:hypothetical protein [Actinomycetota bacterium]
MGAVALLVFAASACTFANEPYQIPADLLPKNTTTTSAAPAIPACVQSPRGSAADAVMGYRILSADGGLYTLSLRTGVSTKVEVPDGGSEIADRPSLAPIRSAVYGIAPQQNVLIDYVSTTSVGLDLAGWTLPQDGLTPILGSFDERVLVALEKTDTETGQDTAGVGAVSLDGVLAWVVTTGISQEDVPPVRPSYVLVNAIETMMIIVGVTEATPTGQYASLTLVETDGTVVGSDTAWPREGSTILGWQDNETVVIEDVATGLRVVGRPFAAETEPFDTFATVDSEDLRLAGDGRSALVMSDSSLSLVNAAGVTTWTAAVTCDIQISR